MDSYCLPISGSVSYIVLQRLGEGKKIMDYGVDNVCRSEMHAHHSDLVSHAKKKRKKEENVLFFKCLWFLRCVCGVLG